MNPEVARELASIVGPERLFATPEAVRPYGHDAWPVSVLQDKLGRHPHTPDVAVQVSSEHEVVAVLACARAHDLAVTTRGLGSSVTGQPLPVRGGLVLDLSGLTGEPCLDEVDQVVAVPAGVRGSDLESWLGERGYTLNHFPQSLYRSSVGGWLATRASGQLSSKYGGIENLVAGYRVILADGTSVDMASRPRSAVGPDLQALFLGSEGTLGVIVHVALRVFRRAECLTSRAYALPSVHTGIEIMRAVVQYGLTPSLVRLYDPDEARHTAPSAVEPGEGLLLFSHDGPTPVAEAEQAATARIALDHGARELGSGPVDAWYANRFDFSSVESQLATPGGYAETIEVAHLWSHLEQLYTALRAALAPLTDQVLCHISHVYTHGASLYVIVSGQADDDDAALSVVEAVWKTAMKLTVSHGGEISHHHGAGLARQEFIAESLGNRHQLLGRLKTALDPARTLNPGKLGLD